VPDFAGPDMNPYVGIAVLILAACGFAAVMLALSYRLGPKCRTATKQLPFECGAVSVGSIRQQRFNVRYYLVAVAFVLFDVEVVFLYPWAAALEEVGWPGFFQMLVFITVLGVGLFYIWRKGVLDWVS
jgi:NADH-quinone oxidoreductase subunit A